MTRCMSGVRNGLVRSGSKTWPPRRGRQVVKTSVRSSLTRVRKICLSLPETSERLSHGAPTFFIGGKRSFVTFMDNHHGDGRLALWCASSAEIRGMLIQAQPRHYFVPPYVGYLAGLAFASIRASGGTKSRTR